SQPQVPGLPEPGNQQNLCPLAASPGRCLARHGRRTLALLVALPFGYFRAAPPPCTGGRPIPAVFFRSAGGHTMAENRNEQLPSQPAPFAPLLAAEVLRNAAAPSEAKTKPKGEESVSPFWRIFGATILSIVALGAVTLYQQLANGLGEVRHE